MWTAEDVRVACNLQPFDQFRNNDSWRREMRGVVGEEVWLNERSRRTGRTTQMYCEILAALANRESVCVFVLNWYQKEFAEEEIGKMAKRGNIPWTGHLRIKVVEQHDRLFVDHSVGGEQ
jgi:hypothetical protein